MSLSAADTVSSSSPPQQQQQQQQQFNFNAIIASCRRSGVYTQAVRAAVEYMSSGKVTAPGLTSVIKIYGLAALVDDAIAVLDAAASAGVRLNALHYNAVINVCRRHKRCADAVDVYRRLGASDVRPDLVTCSSMIGVYGDMYEWAQALDVFYQVPVADRDQVMYIAILSTLERSGRADEAETVLAELQLSGVEPNVSVYTSVVSVLGKAGRWERAYQLYQEMTAAGLAPDKVLVYTMVRILEKAGELDKAALVKQSSMTAADAEAAAVDMDRGGNVTPYFNDLIREGKRSGDFRGAEEAADAWLGDEASALSAGGLTACISIYSLAKRPDKALGVLTAARRRGFPADLVHYNAVMAACVRGNRPDDALQLFDGLLDTDSAPPVSATGEAPSATLERDAYTYGTALGAYAKKGLWQEALALLRKVEGLAGAGARVRLTTVMYNTVLSALGKAGQSEAAVDLYESMFASPGTAPDRVTHFTLMAALEADGRRKQAVQLRAHLRTGKTDFFAGLRAGAADVPGDGGNVVVVVDKADEDLLADTDITLSPAGTLRDKILSAGRRRGAGAGAGKAFKWEKGGGGAASLMKLLGAAGQVDAAERLLRQLEADNGNEPLPTALYNAAIEACGGAGGGAGDWRRALALYASMSGKQVARDVQTYRAIVPLLEAAAMTAEPEADHALRLVLARAKLEGLSRR